MCSGMETRHRIIDAAIRVFSKYGYGRATIRMIAKEAQVSVGGVYLYFKSKEEIALQVMRQKLEEYRDKVIVPASKIENPVEAVEFYIKNALDFILQNKALVIAYTNEKGFSFGIDIQMQFYEKERNVLIQILKRGIERGLFHEFNSTEMANLIMNIIGGAVFSIAKYSDYLIGPRECINILMKGLLKR